MRGLKASVAKADFQRKTADNQMSNDEATRCRRNGARGNVDRYVTTECGSEAKRNKFEDNCWPTLVCASPTTGSAWTVNSVEGLGGLATINRPNYMH